MPAISDHDPRTRLTREKYFSLRPKPLEQWLWQQGVPPSAERVFWLHWEAGMRSGDWCSSLPLSQVARLCCLDVSTVTRAYQWLKSHELIRREDPGRDPSNPFQQATAITEVRVPRALLTELGRYANRVASSSAAPAAITPASRDISMAATAVADTGPEAAPASAPALALPRLKYREFQHVLAKLSSLEKLHYTRAFTEGQEFMTFAADTALSPLEQQTVQQSLLTRAQAMREAAQPPARVAATAPVVSPSTIAGPRRLSAWDLQRCRRRVGECVPSSEVAETWRQVVWAIEEGALRRFEASMALNIALKKLREGAWTRPHRLPPQWQVGARGGFNAITLRSGGVSSVAGSRAQAETCSAA